MVMQCLGIGRCQRRLLQIFTFVVSSSLNEARARSCALPLASAGGQRLNITLEGKSLPLGLVHGAWSSSRLGTQVMSIILEEVYGFNTRITECRNSIECFYAVAGCLDPSHPEVTGKQCGGRFSEHHIAFEVWPSNLVDGLGLTATLETAIVDLGSVGYYGQEGLFLSQDILSAALVREGAALQYYMSYNRSWHDQSIYFSAFTSINSSKLRTCSEQVFFKFRMLDKYVDITQDTEGVEHVNGALRLKCQGGAEGKWWLSPSCRSSPSKCIPLITTEQGWHTIGSLTKAAVYNMPIAYAFAASEVDYKNLPYTARLLYYWWKPDDAFLKQDAAMIIFPPHNATAYSKGDLRSAPVDIRLLKMGHYQIESVSYKIYRFVQQVQFSLEAMDDMMLDFVLSNDTLRSVACRWLQQNPGLWRSWIPGQRECDPGWGMVNTRGGYVYNRTLAKKCAFCEPGYFSKKLVDETGRTRVCSPCIPGKCQTHSGKTVCTRCEAGKFSNYSAGRKCSLCEPGKYSKSNSSKCDLCLPGEYAASKKSQACGKCSLGRYAASAGSSDCIYCEEGRYADIGGMTACIRCGANRSSSASWTTMKKIAGRPEWTHFEGASSIQSCGCDKGLRLEDGECLECGEGMICPGMGNVSIVENYYSQLHVSVFHCFGDVRRCPGGLPGETCATGRRGISCAECDDAKKPSSNGTCVDCTRSDMAPFIILCAAVFLMLCLIYYLLQHTGTAVSNQALLLSMISISQFVTLVQQLGVIGMMDAEFEEPLASLLHTTRLFVFDIEIVNMGCVGTLSPFSLFMATSLLYFVLLGLMLAIHVFSVLLFYQGKFTKRMPALASSLGTVCLLNHITVISMSLAPIQCSRHPNGKSTVRSYKSVVCWDSKDSPDHTAMVIVGLFCLSAPIAFVSFVVWNSFRLPRKIRELDVEFLDIYSFLFSRFRPGSGWYINAILIKSTLIGQIPILPHPLVQIFLMYVVHLLSLIAVVHFKPWRVGLANAFDATLTFVMLTMVVLVSFYVRPKDLAIFSWVLLCCSIMSTLIVPVTCARAAYLVFVRRRKPYQFFLCHHKAKAGAFARLLKSTLVEHPRVSRGVFLDSDNLEHLDALFHTVAQDVERFVIIGTAGVFLRPWCAGEMTIARLKKVKVTLIAMPDWQPPDDATIENFDKLVDIHPLIENNISMESVQSTLRWIGELPTVAMPALMGSSTMESLAACLISRTSTSRTCLQRSASSICPAPSSRVLILADESNLEAVASADFLARLLLPHYMHSPLDVPSVLRSGQWFDANDVETLIVICTDGCFEQQRFLQVLVKACESGARGLPVVSDTNFMFPSPEWLSSLRKETSTVAGISGEEMANMIGRLFHGIATTFQPQHAQDAVLHVNAKQIADRIDSTSMKPMLTAATNSLSKTQSLTNRKDRSAESEQLDLRTAAKVSL